MQKLLWISLCCLAAIRGWAATNLASPGATGPPAASSPTAAELIQRLGATQDKLWTSFVATMEIAATFGGTGGKFGPGEWHRGVETWEYRCDGERTFTHMAVLRSGMLSGANELKHPSNTYYLWDGRTWYEYSYVNGRAGDLGPLGKEGTLLLTNGRPRNPYYWRSTVTGFIAGYFYGLNGDERIDAELRRATNISVSPRMETINGAACYVINASGGGCEYRVWIDPQHDYNMAKAIIRRNWTSVGRPEGYRIPPPAGYQVMQLTVLGFQLVDGVWLAKEGDWHREWHGVNSEYSAENSRIKITKCALNPDHEALGSFKTTFIREGARVYLARWSRGERPVSHVWRQGKPVLE